MAKGIKIKITFGDLAKEKKDGDIDFKVWIGPNDYTLKFEVEDEVDDQYKRYLYEALELISSRRYKGISSTEFEQKHNSGELETHSSSQDAINAEAKAIEAEEKKDKKRVGRKASDIHQKITAAQQKYKNAAKAKYVPNNTFKVGKGRFFVDTQANHYLMPAKEGISTFHYAFHGKKNMSKYTEEAILDEMKAEGQMKLTNPSSFRTESPEPPSSLGTNGPVQKLGTVKYILSNYAKYQKYKGNSNRINEAKLKIWSLNAQRYSYSKNRISPDKAKLIYQGFPDSIKSSSGKNTIFLASILAEPARHSVNHITNMLLLDDRSDLSNVHNKKANQLELHKKKDRKKGDGPENVSSVQKEKLGVYEHTSMTRGGTDPNKDKSKDYPKDRTLSKHRKKNIPPSQVTDRDLRAIQLNPKLEKLLQAKYKEMASSKKRKVVAAMSKIIGEYLGM